MFERIYGMLVKEMLELRRDRWALFRLTVPVILQLIIFGYAATFTINHVTTAILDLDRSQPSRELVSAFTATGRFDVVDIATSQEQITHDIDTGAATVAIVIHAGFARKLGNGQSAPLQVAVDGTNSNTALIALGYISEIAEQFQANEMNKAYRTRNQTAPTTVMVSLQERPWFNAGLEDPWFFIPGVIGTLTLIQVVNLTAFAVVREREVGTLEQIMVSPIRPVEFILGKTVPFFLIGLADVTLITVLGVVWFRIPFLGSPLTMLLSASLFLISALSLGLLLSTFSRTQQQAFALHFFLTTPIYILSGFAFPVASMPPLLQWLTLINPLRYFLVTLRTIFLKGAGIGILWPDLAMMALLGGVMLSVSVFRFRKSLD